MALTEQQIDRYSRHILLKEVGGKGQEKLLNAKALILGAGGLGSPAALYLAAAGVGKIGLMDFDAVDVSNLQRQILHSTKDVGRPKVESGKDTLEALNPDVKVVPIKQRLTSDNAMEVFKEYDVILDGCDNFATRYLVNDACVFLKKPNVHGSIFMFEGQVTVFSPGKGPCYRCLYPEPPPPGSVPSCSQAGVIGVLPGIVGTLQALEAIKLILGEGDPLIGRLLKFDALPMTFKTYKIRHDEHCTVCGKNPSITKLIDYVEFCGGVGEG
ncbi:MAG: molybdopterin-synthase adenylyltransferase MoeB [Bdellovibrionota bacterium]